MNSFLLRQYSSNIVRARLTESLHRTVANSGTHIVQYLAMFCGRTFFVFLGQLNRNFCH